MAALSAEAADAMLPRRFRMTTASGEIERDFFLQQFVGLNGVACRG